MGIRDVLSKLSPIEIMHQINSRRERKQIKLLCENNPKSVSDWIHGGFETNRSIGTILSMVEELVKEGKDVDIDGMLYGLLDSQNQDADYHSSKKLIKFAIENGLEFDVEKIKNSPNLLSEYDIAKYLHSKGEIGAYDFCKLHKPSPANISEMVGKDIRCIEFDYTNNPQLYESVINQLSSKIQSDMQNRYEQGKPSESIQSMYTQLLNSLNASKNVINYRRKKEEGKYYFPESEMFNNLRNLTRTYMSIENPEELDYSQLRTLNKPFEAFYERDGFFDKEFGEKIAQMYYDDSTVLGVHNTDGISNEYTDDSIKKFFDEGLRNLADAKTVTGNVCLQEDMYGGKQSLAELLYWCHDMSGKYNLLFQFPRNLVMAENSTSTSPLIENSEVAGYIPPKYIVGAYDRESSDAKLIANKNFYRNRNERSEMKDDMIYDDE